MVKLDVLHAAIIETARRSHPYEGHKLSADRWDQVLADPDFRARFDSKFDSRRWAIFRRDVKTCDVDYDELRVSFKPLLQQWQSWPALRAYFYSLDADLQLKHTGTEPFLSEIVMDVVHEEFSEQVARGYLKL